MHTQFSNNPLDGQTIYHHRSGCSTGFLLCPWLHVEQWRSTGDSIWFFEMSHHCTPFLSQSWSRRNSWEPATWTNWAWRPGQSLFTLWKCISCISLSLPYPNYRSPKPPSKTQSLAVPYMISKQTTDLHSGHFSPSAANKSGGCQVLPETIQG